jgi:hypothetical protein
MERAVNQPVLWVNILIQVNHISRMFDLVFIFNLGLDRKAHQDSK